MNPDQNSVAPNQLGMAPNNPPQPAPVPANNLPSFLTGETIATPNISGGLYVEPTPVAPPQAATPAPAPVAPAPVAPVAPAAPAPAPIAPQPTPAPAPIAPQPAPVAPTPTPMPVTPAPAPVAPAPAPVAPAPIAPQSAPAPVAPAPVAPVAPTPAPVAPAPVLDLSAQSPEAAMAALSDPNFGLNSEPAKAITDTPVENNAAPIMEPVQTVAPVMAPSTVVAPGPYPTKKSKKGLVIGLILGILILGGGGFAAYYFLLGGQLDHNDYENNAIFIREKKDSGNYAIFKNDGTKLTDFEYSYGGEFVDGHALACKKSGDTSKCGIVTAVGTESVKLGKYEDIIDANGLYAAFDGKKSYLITAKGKEIASFSNKISEDEIVFKYSSSIVAIRVGDGKYSIYNRQGDKLKDFDSSETPTLIISLDDESGISGINYTGNIIIADSSASKAYGPFPAERKYDYIGSISADKNHAVIMSDDDDIFRAGYAYFANGNFREIPSNECNRIQLGRDSITGEIKDYAYCIANDNDYILKEDGTKSDHKLDYTSKEPYYDYYDSKHYIKVDHRNNKITIYKNDEEVKTVSGSNAEIVGAYYNVQDYNGKTSILYDADGNEVYRVGNYLSSLDGVDPNGNIIVYGASSNDYRRYIVAKDGTKLTGNYDYLYYSDGFYIARNGSAKRFILDKNGKEIKTERDYGYFSAINDKLFFASDDKGTNDIVDTNGSIVISGGDYSYIHSYGYYIKATTRDDACAYYTMDGKEIYKQQ